MRRRHVPLRRCVVCREQRPKADLLRLVRTPAGAVDVDAHPKAAGRGAYVCRTAACLRAAADGNRVAQALKAPLPDPATERLRRMADDIAASGASGACQDTVEV